MKGLDKIADYFQKPSSFYAGHIHEKEEGIVVALAEFEVAKGSELSLVDSWTYYDFETMQKLPPKPVYLVLSGRKVIAKQIALEKEENADTIIQKAFPSLNLEDIHSNVYSLGISKYQVSLIRKNNLEVLLDQWPKQFPILGIKIGLAFALEYLKGLKESELDLAFHQFDLNKHLVRSSEGLQEGEVNLFSEEVPRVHAGAFFVAIEACLKANNTFIELERVIKDREQFVFSSLTKRILWPLLVSVLVLLLASFMTFSHFHQKIGETQANFQSQLLKVEELEKLKEAWARKQDFVQNYGAVAMPCAEVINELGRKVPSAIKLESFEVYPLKKKKQKEGLFEFNTNEIRVKGISQNLDALAEWQESIKECDWLEELKIKAYEEEEVGGVFELSLKIHLP